MAAMRPPALRVAEERAGRTQVEVEQSSEDLSFIHLRHRGRPTVARSAEQFENPFGRDPFRIDILTGWASWVLPRYAADFLVPPERKRCLGGDL